jgi:hypothetical protein
MILDVVIKDENGETVGKLVLNPKDFKTGSKGFYGSAKLAIAGKSYQAQCQLVEIGSKAAAGDAKK